jgi:hypothetical protein
MRSSTKIKPIKIDRGLPLKPIEAMIDLETILNIKLQNRNISCYLSMKNGDYQFTFGWYLKGIHPDRTIEKFTAFAESVRDGLLDIPKNEKLTLHYSSFSGSEERVKALSQLGRSNSNKFMHMVVLDEIKKAQELSCKRRRNTHSLAVYATFTISPKEVKAKDFIEGIIYFADSQWQKNVLKSNIAQEDDFNQMINKAFNEGFMPWEQLLQTRMELDITPMSVSDLWREHNKRFGIITGDAHPPQFTVYDSEITEVIDDLDPNSEIHLSSYPFIGSNSLPVAHKQGMKINNSLVGIAIFSDKPYGWENFQKQVRYTWESVFSRISDIELFIQITAANAAMINQSANLIMRQSETNGKSAKFTDVLAESKAKKAIEAQNSMIDGSVPLTLAMTFVVHRERQQELDSAMLFLQKAFRIPARIDVEQEYGWKVWLQTLPHTVEKLLLVPFDRRLTYLHSEVPPLMSLTKPYSLHTKGIELITNEGGASFFIDLTKHFNLLALGATRSGKSLIVGRILTDALMLGIPVCLIDIPPSKAASTFHFWSECMDGAYLDINQESVNVFRRPDVSHLDPETAEEWQTEHKYFLQSLLIEIVYIAKEDPTIKQILALALDCFFEDERILELYEAAEKSGFGSPEWKDIPTLQTFLKFFQANRNKIIASGGEEIDQESMSAANKIDRQIRALLTTQVGRAVGNPCTVDSDKHLIVYALRGLNDSSGSDAAILAMAAYAAAIRNALKYPASVFFIDEFSVLLKFPAIGDLIARLVANGAKAGIRVFMAAQDPNTLADSSFGPKIIQNVAVRLIGRIEVAAKESFVRTLRIPSELVDKNADDDFKLNATEVCSNWLIDTASCQSYAKHFSPATLLGMLANNPPESAARNEYIKFYSDKYKAILEFSKALVKSIQTDQPITLPQNLQVNSS